MGYPAPAVSSHLGLRVAPFRFIRTPSQSFLLAQQSVLLSASNCAAHFILTELSQCSSVHWHRYQMQGILGNELAAATLWVRIFSKTITRFEAM